MMKKQNLRTTTRPDQLTERTEGTACNCALWLLGADGDRGATEKAGIID